MVMVRRHLVPGSIVLMAILLFFIFINLVSCGSGRTITVDDDGGADYTTILDAVDNSTDGDVIRIFNGSYKESIIINTSISLIGNGSEDTFITLWNVRFIIEINADDVVVRGLNISNNHQMGILIESDGNIIEYNSIQCKIGMWLNNSHNNQIVGNYFRNWDYHGYHDGIGMSYSNNNLIANNTFINLHQAIDTHWHCHDTMIMANTFNNTDYGIEGVYFHNGTLMGNQFMNCRDQAIDFSHSHDLEIRKNVIFIADEGIGISHSDFGQIIENELSHCDRYGISIYWCENSTVRMNECLHSVTGIELQGGTNNTISSNIIFNNSESGIYINSATSFSITNNNISSNYSGIKIYCSPWLTVEGNQINYNIIINSTYNGILYEEERIEEVDARYNWWGHITGPKHFANNSNGLGDIVSESIVYDPWLISEKGGLSDELSEGDGENEGLPTIILYVILFGLATLFCFIMLVILKSHKRTVGKR